MIPQCNLIKKITFFCLNFFTGGKLRDLNGIGTRLSNWIGPYCRPQMRSYVWPGVQGRPAHSFPSSRVWPGNGPEPECSSRADEQSHRLDWRILRLQHQRGLGLCATNLRQWHTQVITISKHVLNVFSSTYVTFIFISRRYRKKQTTNLYIKINIR